MIARRFSILPGKRGPDFQKIGKFKAELAGISPLTKETKK